MTKPLVGVNGSRQPRALVVALRRIAKDPKATVTQRLRACELQAIIAGYIKGHKETDADVAQHANGNLKSGVRSFPTSKRLRDLMDKMRHEKSGGGSPGTEEAHAEPSQIGAQT
jgi:hypothetical protein